MQRFRIVAFTIVASFLLTSSQLRSQQRATPPAQTTPATERVETIEFAPDGIALEHAVRLALKLSAEVARAREEARRAEGAALEQRGFFDSTLAGRAFYEYRQQELTQTVKDDESEKRTDLADALAGAQRDYQQLVRLADLLRTVSASPAGSAQQLAALDGIDPNIGAQVRALETLIRGQSNATTRQELQRIRNDFLARQAADASAGAARAIDGYEEGQEQLRRLGATPKDEVLYNGGFELTLSRRLRAGIAIAPFLDGRVEGDNYKGKPRSEDDGGKGLEDLYTFRGGLDITVPLGRGRGADATAANERAAAAAAAAAQHDLRFTQSRVIFDVARAYWSLRAAMGNRAALADQVKRQNALVELTQAVIDAGDQPATAISRVRASEARAIARLRETERGLVDARAELARAMGTAADTRDTTLPLASDAFPEFPPTMSNPDSGTLIAAAARGRSDQLAAASRQQASAIAERGAQTDLRPKLDVRSRTWYTALAEQSVGAAIDRWVGPSTDLQIEYERPFGNNQARGRHEQRSAERRQADVDAVDTRRQIELDLLRTSQTVSTARERVEQARVAAAAGREATISETERFRAGDATLIDVILSEDQQTEAELALIDAQSALAQLIAEIRFASGTLLRATTPDLEPGALVSLPYSGNRH